jgi:hypothetical protein
LEKIFSHFGLQHLAGQGLADLRRLYRTRQIANVFANAVIAVMPAPKP